MTPNDLESLFTKYNSEFKASADEISAWGTLKTSPQFYDPSTVPVSTSAGLFGADLTDFNKDCAALEDKCNKDDYKDYTGWGLGVNWAPSDVVTVD